MGLDLSRGCRGRQASSEVSRLLLRKSQKVETLFELGGSLSQSWSWEEPGVLPSHTVPLPLSGRENQSQGQVQPAFCLPFYQSWA